MGVVFVRWAVDGLISSVSMPLTPIQRNIINSCSKVSGFSTFLLPKVACLFNFWVLYWNIFFLWNTCCKCRFYVSAVELRPNSRTLLSVSACEYSSSRTARRSPPSCRGMVVSTTLRWADC